MTKVFFVPDVPCTKCTFVPQVSHVLRFSVHLVPNLFNVYHVQNTPIYPVACSSWHNSSVYSVSAIGVFSLNKVKSLKNATSTEGKLLHWLLV